MNQSTSLRDLPKDPMQNPEEARLVQSIINENNPEMGYGGYQQMQGGMQPGQGMQDGQNFIPNFDDQADMIPQLQNPSMPPGVMGGAQPIQMQMGHSQMPQQVEPPMMMPPQQQMGYPQQQQQQMYNPQMMCGPNGCDLPFEDDRGWTEWLWDESKDTLIITIVAFILSFRIIQNLIVNNVPYMSSGMLYMIFRSLLIGIFFYIIKKVWN